MGKKEHKIIKIQDGKNHLTDPKQFIIKNEKENMVLKKILKKLNVPLEENEQVNINP